MLDYNHDDLVFNGLILQDSNLLVKNCPDNFISEFSTSAYLLSSDVYTKYTSGYYKTPIQFESADGLHCGFLFVRYENGGKIIKIEGYAWNQIAGQSCNYSGTGWLGIDESIKLDIKKESYKYYNLMGQELSAPTGLVLKVYESGYTEKIYY